MSNRLFLATRKGLFRYDRASDGKWKIALRKFLGDHITFVLADQNSSWVYVAIGHGHFGVKFHRSSDSGETWEETEAPKYPPMPEGEEENCSYSGRKIPWNTEMIWGMQTGGKDHPERLWCGTIPGGLFRSEDRGATWNIVESLWYHPDRKGWFGGGMDLPGIHSICVNPEDNNHVAIGISCAGVWQTKDGGDNWTCEGTGMYGDFLPPEIREKLGNQDVHCLAQSPSDPKTYWVQHHNAVFVSRDEGKTWNDVQTISPSVFGFVCVVHPTDPNKAWFVPAIKDEKRIPVDGKLVVARTSDGGKTCEELRNGLPQEDSYDLVYRHGLAIDDSGDRLAFGSTTGSAWITENQGNQWELLSNHLPPIYAVQFAP